MSVPRDAQGRVVVPRAGDHWRFWHDAEGDCFVIVVATRLPTMRLSSLPPADDDTVAMARKLAPIFRPSTAPAKPRAGLLSLFSRLTSLLRQWSTECEDGSSIGKGQIIQRRAA